MDNRISDTVRITPVVDSPVPDSRISEESLNKVANLIADYLWIARLCCNQ